ncbi:MAG: hypothetical protein K8823_713 [Cenarchaeum symbiont of Oopsacas minuta]|nr:hypothetical protein [Cenarchaeum symbiont of Oopsacas minuta]
MGFRTNRPRKEKATYLIPNTIDESKLLSIICGKMLVEFSILGKNYGKIMVQKITNNRYESPSEYKIDAIDFNVTIVGLHAAMLNMSQKSLPAKQFNLDEIIKSNAYKKISSIENLKRRGGSKFHIAYDRDEYPIGMLGMVHNRCILLGFVLLERFASKSSSEYGDTLMRFRFGNYIH